MVAFRWDIPEKFNIGADVADRYPSARALIEIDPSGAAREFTFDAISALSNRLANVLVARGLQQGDRIATLLPQRHETAVTHVAAWKVGLISVPLFTLFGEEALEFRLQNSGARAIVTDRDQLPKLASLRERLRELQTVLCVDGPEEGALDLHALLAKASDRFEAKDTLAEDPAFIIYTSGTTGQPKGALHAHRALLGHLPGVEYPHDGFPQSGDRFWTPADWAWIGGLFDGLLSRRHHGVCVLAYRAHKFDPEEAFALMAKHGGRNTFMPPTALKLMRQVSDGKARATPRTVASGGETLGDELLDWGRASFGVTINEFYGQTECNL